MMTFLKLLLGLVDCVDEQQTELSFLDFSKTLLAFKVELSIINQLNSTIWFVRLAAS